MVLLGVLFSLYFIYMMIARKILKHADSQVFHRFKWHVTPCVLIKLKILRWDNDNDLSQPIDSYHIHSYWSTFELEDTDGWSRKTTKNRANVPWNGWFSIRFFIMVLSVDPGVLGWSLL